MCSDMREGVANEWMNECRTAGRVNQCMRLSVIVVCVIAAGAFVVVWRYLWVAPIVMYRNARIRCKQPRAWCSSGRRGSGRDRTRRSLGMDSPTLALSRRMEVEVGSGKRLTCARRCPAAGAKCTANALSSQRATVAQRSDGGSEQEAKVPWCSQISGEERKTGSGC